MNVDEMIQGAQSALAVSRVYGEPIKQNGVTLIPTAEVMGGGGGKAVMPLLLCRSMPARSAPAQIH